MLATRAELNMRVVMPSVVPHSRERPYLPVQRFECGPGGNPHYHGVNIGDGNPRLGVLSSEAQVERSLLETVGAEVAGPRSDDEGEALSAGASVVSGGAGAATDGAPRRLKRHSTNERARRSVGASTKLLEAVAKEDSLEEKTAEFWKFFKHRVSEWNPCFTEEGEQRVFFALGQGS